jgi:opacity protein-like surface antigen
MEQTNSDKSSKQLPMNKPALKWILLGCAAMVLTQPRTARAEGKGGYLKLDGGANFAESMNLTVDGLSGKLDLDVGYRVDLAAGYQFNRWLSLELEAGFFHNENQSVTLLNMTEHLENTWLQGIPVLANVYLRYENRTDFVPYIGGGAGMVVSWLSLQDNTDTCYVFAYQFAAGVTYRLEESAWIDFGYKFLGTADPEYEIGARHILGSDTRNHFLGASVVWKF